MHHELRIHAIIISSIAARTSQELYAFHGPPLNKKETRIQDEGENLPHSNAV